MAWVTIGKRRCYFRSVKVQGRVRGVYFGFGPAAQAAAAEDEQRRRQQQEQTQLLRTEEQNWAAAGSAVQAVEQFTEGLLRGLLLVSGYRQHDRGPWRRTRERAAASAN